MKIASRILMVMAIATLFFSSCKEDDKAVPKEPEVVKETGPEPIIVAEANMSIINKMTATWCGPCGQWGWTLFQDIIDATEHDAVIMGTYGSNTSNYYNVAAGAFKAAQAPSAGWPAFCANGFNRTEYSSTGGIYTTTTKTNVVTEVTRFKTAEVIASAGYRVEIKNDSIMLDLKTQFFKDGDAAAEYYVSAVVIEDGVIGYQNGNSAGNNAKHHHVLRGSFTTDTWGTKIEGGTATGNTFEQSLKLPVDASWNKDNLEYAVIIWKKIGPKYLFVNAFQNKS